MQQSVAGVVALLIGLLTLVSILGVAFVYFRGSADKATIESQGRLLASRKDEIEDLTRRVVVLENENKHLLRSVAQVTGIDVLQITANAIKDDTAYIREKVA